MKEVLFIIEKETKGKCFQSQKYSIDVEVYYGGSVDNSNIKDIFNICDGVMLDKDSYDINLLKELLKEI